MPPASRCFRTSSTCRSGRTSARAWPAAPFDQEGAATRDRELVQRRGARGLRARQLFGAASSGSRPPATPAASTISSSRAADGGLDRRGVPRSACGTGLLVTELMGQGVNGVTGDYSRGASGFWVENGVIAYPVHEITIAGNLEPMYRDIVALGGDRRRARRHPHRLGAHRRDDDRRGVSGLFSAREVSRVVSVQRRARRLIDQVPQRELAAAAAPAPLRRSPADGPPAGSAGGARRRARCAGCARCRGSRARRCAPMSRAGTSSSLVGHDQQSRRARASPPSAPRRCRAARARWRGRFTLQRRPPATCVRPTKYMSLSASCSSSTLERRSCCKPEPQVGRVLHVERQLRAGEQDQPAEVGPQQRRHHEGEARVHDGEARGVDHEGGEHLADRRPQHARRPRRR